MITFTSSPHQNPAQWTIPTPRNFPGAYIYPDTATHFPGNIFGMLDAIDAGVCDVGIAGESIVLHATVTSCQALLFHLTVT